MAIDQSVIELAMTGGGLATRADIIAIGKSRFWIDREVAARRLTLVKPGVYRVLDLTSQIDVLRAALVGLPSAIVSHEAAAHLLRFPKPPPWKASVTVHSRTTHRFPGVTVHRTGDLLPEHIVRVDGLRSTNVMRTVTDLAAQLTLGQLDTLVEDLVLAGRLDLSAFAAFAQALCRRGKAGCAAVTNVIQDRLRSGAPTATALERLGLEVLRAQGVPEPVLEYPAPWADDERIDAAYPPQLIGIEWDSKTWHSARERFENDRRRDRLAALAGWTVLRYTWADLTERPTEVGDQIRALLAARST